MEVSITGIPALLILCTLIVLPLKLAASWFEASRCSFWFCLLAAVAAPIAAYIAFSLTGGGFIGFIAALILTGITLGAILGTSVGAAIKLAFVAVILIAAFSKAFSALVISVI
ncbi:MAG: hypothetical protein JXR18_14560 [Neptuniibacter sp.]